MRGDFLGVKTVTVLLTFLQNLSVKGVPPTAPPQFWEFFSVPKNLQISLGHFLTDFGFTVY